MSSAKGVGIPVKLLHEAEGHVLTVSIVSSTANLQANQQLSSAYIPCRLSSSPEKRIGANCTRQRTTGTVS